MDLSRADLNLLVLFEAVLAERHVGRTAEKLNLSPSAVSHGLTRLRRLFNDPLFLKTPRGVVPTDRANELAEPIADLLARARSVLSTSLPFDPRTSQRRFSIGAPDGVSAFLLLPLLSRLQDHAPHIDIGVKQLLPQPGETSLERAWRGAFADLESRALDVAIIPSDVIPPRFERRCLFEEDFVIAARAGHAFARDPSLKRYCAERHCVVSHSGDPYGFVDQHLAERGHSRRVALTVPNFMFALAVVGESDLICALPRRLVSLHAARFGIVGATPPITLPKFQLNAVTPKVAMMDAGVAWLFQLLDGENAAKSKKPKARR